MSSGDDEAEFAWLPVNALRPFAEGKQEGIGASSADPTLQVLQPRRHQHVSELTLRILSFQSGVVHAAKQVGSLRHALPSGRSSAGSCLMVFSPAVQECIAAAEQAEVAQAKSLAVRQASASSSGVPAAVAEEDTDSDGGAQHVHSSFLAATAACWPTASSGLSLLIVASCGHAYVRQCANGQSARGSQVRICAGWGLPPPSEQTPTPRRGGRGRGRRGGRARGGRGMKGRGRGWRRGGGRGDDFDSVSCLAVARVNSRHTPTCHWPEHGPDAGAV